MLIEILKISVITFMFVRLSGPGEVFCWYQKLIDPLPEWLWRPLGGCERCFTGQALFWYYIFAHFSDYNIVNHLFYPSLGIFLVILYGFIYDKLTE